MILPRILIPLFSPHRTLGPSLDLTAPHQQSRCVRIGQDSFANFGEKSYRTLINSAATWLVTEAKGPSTPTGIDAAARRADRKAIRKIN
jgi:hypothetical protein